MGGGNKIKEGVDYAVIPELPGTKYSKALEDYKYKPDPSIGYGYAAARRRAKEADADPLNPYSTPEMQKAEGERRQKELMSGELQAHREDNFRGQEIEVGNQRFLADRYGPQVVKPQQKQKGGIWSSIIGAGAQIGAAALLASDERMKEDITPAEPVLPRIGGYNAFNYKWRANKQPNTGVVAQQLARQFPEAVVPGDEQSGTPWAVKPDTIAALALKGVAELNEKLDRLTQGAQPRGNEVTQ